VTEESYGFSQARVRLEEIVGQVRKKDTSLEKSLDLLEEGVRLANQCTELIDQSEWEAAAGRPADGESEAETAGDPDVEVGDATESPLATGEANEASADAPDAVTDENSYAE